MLTLMDVSRLAEALRTMQGGGDPAPGRYRYGGMGGEPMPQPGGQVQMPQPDPLGAILAQLFGGGQPAPEPPAPEPTAPAWQERGYIRNGNGAEKGDVLRHLLEQLNR